MSVSRIPDDKVVAIDRIGFGGLLLLATKELRYELSQWLILAYNVPYYRIRMGSLVCVDVTLRDIEAAMGIPCHSLVLPVHPN